MAETSEGEEINIKKLFKKKWFQKERFPVAVMDMARKEIKELLEMDIHRKSRDSEWTAQIVPIKKKDITLRLAIDYHELNKKTKKPSYPMPRIIPFWW